MPLDHLVDARPEKVGTRLRKPRVDKDALIGPPKDT
jgi:hypothetical protein